MTFDPNYASNGNFYVNYINASGHTNISRFTWSLTDSITSNPNTEKHLMIINQPYNNHNGGCLKFGPDGYLYIGMGDGGSGGDPGNRSQNPKERLGKMLRIDVNSNVGQYGIPADNPYKANKDTLEEIWAMGLRNPWRFSFDKATGDLWIADVGQNKWEEVDFIPAGTKGGHNFGWRCFEGFNKYDFGQCSDNTPFVKPVYTYATLSSGEGCSVTGGYVYRGKEIPYLQGHYIYGDFCTSRIWRLKSNDCGEYKNELINKNLAAQQLGTFGEDNDGELYVAGLGTGKVYKLKQACTLSAEMESIDNASCAEASNGKAKLTINSFMPYTLQVSGPSTDLENLKPGKYSYKIIDSLGCTVSNCFEVGFDTNKLICDVMSMAEVFLCKDSEVLIPNLCEQFEIDSFQIFLNGLWYATTNSLKLTLNQAGNYTFKEFKNGCAYETQNLINIKIDTTNTVPQFTYNGTVAKVTGPYVLFQIFKDGVFVSENSTGLFDVDPIDYGKYTFVGITSNGCSSPASDPLIISSIESTSIDKILIFPNPFNDVLYLKSADVKHFSCYGLDGTLFFQLDKPRESISTENLRAGMYLMKLVQTNKETWVRMVKQ